VTCRLFMVVAAVGTLLMAASAEAASKKAKSKAAATTASASSSTKPKATPRTRGTRGTRKQGTSRSPKVNLQLGLRPRVSIGSGNAKVTLGAGGIGGSTGRSRRRSYY